jgi:hypothetical protein
MANPNPSPGTRFGPGNNANPGGKTKEHRRMELEAAEMAARLRHAILSAMTEKLQAGDNPEELLTSDALRLIKDSEDRAHGTPKQSTELSGPNGGPIQTEDVTLDADAFARRIRSLASATSGGDAEPSAGGASGA